MSVDLYCKLVTPSKSNNLVAIFTHLTYLPCSNIRKQSFTMFHELDPSYCIRLSAYATCE